MQTLKRRTLGRTMNPHLCISLISSRKKTPFSVEAKTTDCAVATHANWEKKTGKQVKQRVLGEGQKCVLGPQ